MRFAMAKRKAYLDMTTVAEALERLWSALGDGRSGEERVSVTEALGRVTSRPVLAATSSPSYRAAAMDGFAVRAADTDGASELRPVTLRVGEQAIDVDTGDVVPDGFDAVIMAEDVWPGDDDTTVVASAPVSRWQHVRQVGEDVVQGEMVLSSALRLEPRHLAVALAAGHLDLWVRVHPCLGIIPTGDELVQPGPNVRPGEVAEFNSKMLAAMLEQWGGRPVVYASVPDDRGRIQAAVERALAECDAALVLAGSSAGREDYTASVLSTLGKLLVHGVNIMPGKPTALAVVAGKPVFGIPGYPVSASVSADTFVGPWIAKRLGLAASKRPKLTARLARKVPSKAGHREVVRVVAAQVGQDIVALPLARGAGVISSLSRATGLVTFDEHDEGAPAGESVVVELLVTRDQVARTLLHVGSHDLALDLVAELLRRLHPGWDMVSASVGSMAGLAALAGHSAHLAGTHLLDAPTGTYNVAALRRVLPDRPTLLVRLALREQGLYLPKKNPKRIGSIADLARDDVTIANRQPGSGTRVLLDHLLAGEHIDPASVAGYDRIESTHSASAEAVRSGAVDTALGIRLAATALGLDFVPLAEEPYELAIPLDLLDDPAVTRFLTALRHKDLRGQLDRLDGYRPERTGEEIARVE